MTTRRLPVALIVLSALLAGRAATAAPEGDPFELALKAGTLTEGEKALVGQLEQSPDDDQARFALGAVQFLRGVERMVQSFRRFGLRDVGGGMVPFLRLPVPDNPAPEPIRYEDLRGIFEGWLADMARAESTLSQIKDAEVKLPVRFGRVRLDLDGDGKAAEDETLWKIYSRFNRQAAGADAELAAAAEGFVIHFDRGDVAWLRGYSHLLSAFAEFYLAHDGRELFEHSAHLIFARPVTPYPILRAPEGERRGGDPMQFIDLIASAHAIRLPVAEPKRMESALRHLEAMVALSRESWDFYLKETDDDREWLPNPGQSTVVPGVRVTEEMVRGWKVFLAEADRILRGEVLLPFWRDAGAGRGLNLRRVFAEPKGFDLVYWVQGTAALPYLDEGPVTRPEVWQQLQRLFGGEFIGFALWFN